MSKIFARANLDWLSSDFFKSLSIKEVGKSIAVLKVFLALALESEFDTRVTKVSYSSLEFTTGLSRPLIAYAISKLKDENLISITTNERGKTNVYLINDAGTKGWAKIPYLSITNNLKKLSNRNPTTLGALKILLVILRHKNSKLDVTSISNDKLRDQTHLQNNKLTICRDILINHELIQLGRILEENGMLMKYPNLYYIVGINGSKQQKVINADEMRAMYPSIMSK